MYGQFRFGVSLENDLLCNPYNGPVCSKGRVQWLEWRQVMFAIENLSCESRYRF